jgi:DNA-binding GntR family transcriptional regulator
MNYNTTKDIESIENLIQNYISAHRLENGSHLPSPHDLAQQLARDEDAILNALRSAETKLRLSSENGVWTVVSPETLSDHAFSFTKSARNRDLATEVIEASVRLPMRDMEHPFYNVEQRARKALDIPPDSEFIVIERLRLLGGIPGALQRAYLNPSRFHNDFLKNHNFKDESLIGLYEKYGYKLLSRDTVLSARLTNLYEKHLINRFDKHGFKVKTSVVLDAEQQLYATDPENNSRVALEFLKASYFENWRYEIKNRTASI